MRKLDEADETLAERRRKALQEFMRANNLTPASWASLAGLKNANVIYNFLHMRSASLNQATYERLAAAVPGASVGQLTGERTALKPTLAATITVRAEAAAGVWKTTPELAVEDQVTAAVPLGGLLTGNAFGVRVAGRDMDRVFPPGSLVVCTSLALHMPGVTSGTYVLVHARKGRLWEVTLRRYRSDGSDDVWLWPDSQHEEYEAPERYVVQRARADHAKQIVALAVGAYVPLPGVEVA
jgi:hypothetical protein